MAAVNKVTGRLFQAVFGGDLKGLQIGLELAAGQNLQHRPGEGEGPIVRIHPGVADHEGLAAFCSQAEIGAVVHHAGIIFQLQLSAIREFCNRVGSLYALAQYYAGSFVNRANFELDFRFDHTDLRVPQIMVSKVFEIFENIVGLSGNRYLRRDTDFHNE
jgi:hypothetical protein